MVYKLLIQNEENNLKLRIYIMYLYIYNKYL